MTDLGLAPNLSAWILTDGKAGDEGQCKAVAEALGLDPELRRVSPRAPFVWAMPWGPIDPRERPSLAASPIRPPWPDVAIGSGRRAVPYLRAVKRGSAGRSFTICLKDPRTGPEAADMIWAPSYDPIRGPNVVTTLTSPHRVSAARLAEARSRPDPRVAALRSPRVAVLVGGHSRHGRFSPPDIEHFLSGLDRMSREGASLVITASRRTPARLRAALKRLVEGRHAYLWDGGGENPYVDMLALADAIVVTSDSVNMISEAVATGTPVQVFDLMNGAARHRAFVAELTRLGAVRAFHGRLERFAYEPLDSTPVIAEAIATRLSMHRAGLDPAGSRSGRRL